MKMKFGNYILVCLSLFLLFYDYAFSQSNNAKIVIQDGHSGYITDVVFSPDYKWLASVCRAGKIKIWDIKSYRLVKTFTIYDEFPDKNNVGWYNNFIAFSPDGKLLAVGGSDKVKVWNVNNDKITNIFNKKVSSITFSPDSKKLAFASKDKGYKILDVESGKEISNYLIDIWDLSITQQSQIIRHSSVVNSISFSPDGRLLAGGCEDSTIQIWDVSNGQILQSMKDNNGQIMSIDFSSNSKLITSGNNYGQAKLWNIEKAQLLNTYTIHDFSNEKYYSYNPAIYVSFSPNDKLLGTTGANKITTWFTKTAKPFKTFRNSSSSSSISFSPDGKYLAIGGNEIKIFDIEINRINRIIKEHNHEIKSIAFSPNKKWLAVVDRNCVHIWDLRNNSLLYTLMVNASTVTYSPNSKRLTIGTVDGKIQIYTASKGNLLRKIYVRKHERSYSYYESKILSIAYSPNGKLLASTTLDSSVIIWDSNSGKLLQTLKGHQSEVNTLAWSPNSNWVASGSKNGNIKLWEVSTGQLVHTMKSKDGQLRTINYSPDGKILSSASSNGSIILWDLSGFESLSKFKGHKSEINSMAFSSDGKILATCGSDFDIKLWDMEKKQLIRTLQGHSGDVNDIVFTPNGRMLASASDDKSIKLWNISSGEILLNFYTFDYGKDWIIFTPDCYYVASENIDDYVHFCLDDKLYFLNEHRINYNKPNVIEKILYDKIDSIQDEEIAETPELYIQNGHSVNALAFSPDSKWIVSGGDGIRLWDVVSGQLINNISEEESISDVSFSSDRKWIVSAGRYLKIYNIQNYQKRPSSTSHSANYLDYSNDGKLLLIASGNKLELFDVFNDGIIQELEGHNSMISAVNFSPDNKFAASASYDSTIKLWNVFDGKLIHTLSAKNRVYSISWSSDSKYLASGDEKGQIKIWDVDTGKLHNKISSHNRSLYSIAYSPNGRKLVSMDGKVIKIWESKNGKLLDSLECEGAYGKTVTFSPDGRWLASAGGEGIRIWDATTSQLQHCISKHSHEIRSVEYSPNGKWLASEIGDLWRPNIKLFDISNNKLIHSLSNIREVHSITFSSDSKQLATGHDREIKIWKTEEGKLIRIITGHEDEVLAVAFSPDNKYLASAGKDSTIKLWDLSANFLARILKGHSKKVYDLVFSPDSRLLASSSTDNTIKLWEVTTGQITNTFKGESSYEPSLDFSPDGKSLARNSYDNVSIWNTATGQLRQNLKSSIRNRIYSLAYSHDGKRLASGSYSDISIWDAETGRQVYYPENSESWGFSYKVNTLDCYPVNEVLVSIYNLKKIKFYNSGNGRHIANFIFIDDSDWICWTPDGYYDCSEGAIKYITWRIENTIYPAEKFANKFYVPNLMSKIHKGEPIRITQEK